MYLNIISPNGSPPIFLVIGIEIIVGILPTNIKIESNPAEEIEKLIKSKITTDSNINLNSSYNSSLSSSFTILSATNISNFKNIISEKIYFYTEINCENENKKK